MLNKETVTGFMNLFSGRQDCYGTGAGRWVKQPLRRRVYESHLLGMGEGIGVAPLLSNGKVNFAAIDLDEPDFEAAKALQKELEWTQTWIERSRSGNAHILTFFSTPIDAWIARGFLKKAINSIDRSKIEIFPKQNSLRKGMYGNYLNLAYHGDTRPIIVNDEPISLEEFVQAANEHRSLTAEWLKRLPYSRIEEPGQNNQNAEFGTSDVVHFCGELILERATDAESPVPIQEGHRHVVYFNLAKMFAHCSHYERGDVLSVLFSIRDASDEQGIDHVPDAELEKLLDDVERVGYTSSGCGDSLMAPYVHPECERAKE